MSDKICTTPPDPRGKARENYRFNLAQNRRWLNRAKLDENDYSTALALLGVNGHAERILWSDMPARDKASRILASLMVCHQAESPAFRTYYFITFIDDCGTTSERTPNLAVETIIHKARRTVSSLDLHAIVMLEVHPLINYPRGGAGRSLQRWLGKSAQGE